MQEWEARFKANHIDWEDFLAYSGKIEKSNKQYQEYEEYIDKASLIKAKKLPKNCRKEYFRQYWLKNKLNQI